MAVQQLIAQINNLNLANPPQWTYANLFHEVLDNNNDQNAMVILTATNALLVNVFGMYGSVNLGVGGAAYTQIRQSLRQVRDGNYRFPNNIPQANYTNLIDFITEPVLVLHAYNGNAGAGGQGQMKIDLNSCISAIKHRTYMVLGVMQLKNCAVQHVNANFDNWHF